MALSIRSFLPVFALALCPDHAAAQEGPSFDCDDAGTATEHAICASPELSLIDMEMIRSYQRLVDRIGQPQARRIADELLARRQACEGNRACIAEELLLAAEVFDRTGLADTDMAAIGPRLQIPTEDDAVAVEPAAPALDADPDVPLAAQAPWPFEAGPVPPGEGAGAALDEAPPVASVDRVLLEELRDALRSADLTSSDGAEAASDEAAFDTPMSWAFMDLSRDERAALQARLAAAGLYNGRAEGTWDRGTAEALNAFVAGPAGQGFDLSTQSGAALALDYIGSEAFAAAYKINTAEELEPGGELTRPGTNAMQAASSTDSGSAADPLAGSEW